MQELHMFEVLLLADHADPIAFHTFRTGQAKNPHPF